MSISADDSIIAQYPPIVVMGVSGAGKSTVGSLLAGRLDAEFIEGDDLHTDGSKSKMAAGVPLEDADRQPWLEEIAESIRRARADGRNVVVACSALKHSYRDVLAQADPALVFVHLAAPRDLITVRQHERDHEYMPSSLLTSQFETLEPPSDDERHLELDVSPTPDAIVRTIIAELSRTPKSPSGAPGAAMPRR